MVVYAYLSIEFGMEDQHSNANRIFMLKSMVDRDGQPEWYGISPRPVGLSMKEDFAQITHMTRIEDRNVVVKKGQNVFQEWTRMVDPSFLEMFDFDVVSQSGSLLEDRNSIIIHEKMAKKYFGDANPIGQTINVRFSGSENIPLTVTAVVSIDEMSTSFYFEFLTHYDLLELADPEFKASDWSENISGTFIMLEDPQNIAGIAEKMNQYIEINNSAQKDWQITGFGFEPVSTIYDNSKDIRWDISRQADVEGHIILSIIASLMIVLACLNYLNIAISSAVKRLKEIGIRKVIGANRSRLILQFMVENILLSFLALILGFILGTTFFLPGLNNLFAINMGIDVLEIDFYIFLIGLLLITAIASGAYPAMYISNFQVVSILKGKLTFGRKNLLSKVFLSIQFVIACISVICGVMFTLNTEYQLERPWGYNQSSTIMVRLDDSDDLDQLKNRLDQSTNVVSTSKGSHHLGVRLASSIVDLPDRKLESRRMDVDANYVNTMELEVLEGRDFYEDYESDRNSVLINETFAKNLGWDDPLGQTFRYDSLQYKVIGVIKDFHYFSFWNEIQPVFLRIGQEDQYRYLAMRTTEKTINTSYEELEVIWSSMFPDLPFGGDFQSQLFKDYFRNTNGHRVLMMTVAIISILMTCLGLYGLVALNISGRIREFSIRKVLGAGGLALSKAVSSHFAIYLIAAFVIGAPLGYYAVKGLMDMIYNYHMQITVYPIIFSISTIVAVILLTLSTHLFRVIHANPTNGLRVE